MANTRLTCILCFDKWSAQSPQFRALRALISLIMRRFSSRCDYCLCADYSWSWREEMNPRGWRADRRTEEKNRGGRHGSNRTRLNFGKLIGLKWFQSRMKIVDEMKWKTISKCFPRSPTLAFHGRSSLRNLCLPFYCPWILQDQRPRRRITVATPCLTRTCTVIWCLSVKVSQNVRRSQTCTRIKTR